MSSRRLDEKGRRKDTGLSNWQGRGKSRWMLTGMISCKRIRPIRMKRSLGNEHPTLIQCELLLLVRKGLKIIKKNSNLTILYSSVRNLLHSMKIPLNYLYLRSPERSTSTIKKKRKKRRPEDDSLQMMEMQLLNRSNQSSRARRMMTMTIYCKSTEFDATKLYQLLVCSYTSINH